MKPAIHPKYFDVEVRCACGNTFKTRSTKPELHLEICNACHPFFTGRQKLIDTEGRVERFTKRFGAQTAEARKQATKAVKAAKASKTTKKQQRPSASLSEVQRVVALRATRQLSIQSIQPVTRLGGQPARGARAERLGVASRGLQIAGAMLVMNRQRFSRAPRERRRRLEHRQIQHVLPRGRGFVVSMLPSSQHREARERLAADRAIARARGQLVRAGGARSHPPHVHRAGRAPTARPVTRSTSAPSRAIRERVRGHGREGHDVLTVVLQHAFDRPHVSGAQELEISRRNLEAGHIAEPVHAEERSLERRQAAVGVPRRPTSGAPAAACRSAAASSVGASRRWNAHRISISGTSNERPLNVTRSDAAPKTSRERVQHRALIGRPAQEKLSNVKPVVLEPAAAGDERERARAAAEPRRLDVEEDDAIGPRGMCGQPRIEERDRRRGVERARLNLLAPVPCVSGIHAVNRDARARFLRVDDAAEIGGRSTDVAPAVEIGHVRELAEGAGSDVERARAASCLTMLRSRAARSRMVDHAAARAATSALSSRDATDLASGPVAPSGPTHDGQPDSHGHVVDQLARTGDQVFVQARTAAR